MKETGAKPIPAFRRQIIHDPIDLPDRYSSTPGGTLYSTTPGGTRIIYERNFLMDLKNSPLAKSPPKMAFIPGVTNIDPAVANTQFKVLQPNNHQHTNHNHHHHHHHQHQQQHHHHSNNQNQKYRSFFNSKHCKKDKLSDKKLASREEQPQFDMDI